VILHTLLSAGGESTTSLLGNAVRILAENSDLQEQLRLHPELIPTFVEEAVRLESPFRYLMRSVRHDTAIGGVDIPDGATVLLLWGAANRDEAEFVNADVADLARPIPKRHVGFGRGIHHCVGAPLARMEARCVLTVLLERTTSITLDPDHRPRWVDSLMARRHEYLPVRIVSGGSHAHSMSSRPRRRTRRLGCRLRQLQIADQHAHDVAVEQDAVDNGDRRGSDEERAAAGREGRDRQDDPGRGHHREDESDRR
jgi:hypothetical protein